MRMPLLVGLVAASVPCVTVADGIPFKHEPASGSPLSGAGLGLLMVALLAAIAVLLVVRKRMLQGQGSTAPRMLRILEKQRLGNDAVLSVVEFKGHHYLVSSGAHGVSCLVGPTAEVRQ